MSINPSDKSVLEVLPTLPFTFIRMKSGSVVPRYPSIPYARLKQDAPSINAPCQPPALAAQPSGSLDLTAESPLPHPPLSAWNLEKRPRLFHCRHLAAQLLGDPGHAGDMIRIVTQHVGPEIRFILRPYPHVTTLQN